MTATKRKDRPKCIGRTKGDFRGSYPCALYAMEGSDYCRYHDWKMLDKKEEARLAKAKQEVQHV
jgi:hypothetical protein